MEEPRLTRRRFVHQTAMGAAALAAGVSAAGSIPVGNAAGADTSKILSYNPDMEYRRCGKTGWMVSAVCLGGHWKRVNKMVPGIFEGDSWLSLNVNDPGFEKNRYDVVTRCIERGINYIDACTHKEIQAYSKALQGRRDKMYLGWSWYEREGHRHDQCNVKNFMQVLDDSLKLCRQEYVDLWRLYAGLGGHRTERGEWIGDRGQGDSVFFHSKAECEAFAEAADRAKKQGKTRMTGVSCHDLPWLKYMMETYPGQMDVVITPYTAKTKALPDDGTGFFAAVKKCDCGLFGIKPFAGTSLFKGDSSPGNPHEEEDNRLARLAIRYILCHPAMTAPIPGLINPQQVDNVALAVKERRELDVKEKAELERAMDRAWANLPYHYRWLKDCEYI